MEENVLKMMIERFFDAEMSVDEERGLCRYLRDNDVPAELQKDKEAIIALCSEENDIVLPSGATERLEAMLDTLSVEPEFETENRQAVIKERRRIVKIPRYIIHSMAVAAVVIMAFIFISIEENVVLENEKTVFALCDNEEDTFDNPEDAMRCMQMVFANVQNTVSATQVNVHEIGSILKQSAKMYK